MGYDDEGLNNIYHQKRKFLYTCQTLFQCIRGKILEFVINHPILRRYRLHFPSVRSGTTTSYEPSDV